MITGRAADGWEEMAPGGWGFVTGDEGEACRSGDRVTHTPSVHRAGTSGPGHTCHVGVFCAPLGTSPFTGTWIPASCLSGGWTELGSMVQSLPSFTPRRKGPCEDPRGCPKAKEVGGHFPKAGSQAPVILV